MMRKRQVETFAADIKAEIGSLAAVVCSFVRFSDYRLITLPSLNLELPGGKTYTETNVEAVAGIGPVIRNESPETILDMSLDSIHSVVLCENIFFEVLDITRNVDPNEGFEAAEPAISTDEVLGLCRKYGLPVGAGQNRIWKQHGLDGFVLRDFKYSLFRLKWRFAVYWAVCHEDYSAIRAWCPNVRLLEGVVAKRKLTDKEALTITKEWLYLENRQIETSLYYDKTLDRFVLRSLASDLIDACDIFLSLLLVSTEEEGMHVKLCPNCGRYFRANHGRQKYCPKCNPKTVWSRRDRANKRKQREGAEQNV